MTLLVNPKEMSVAVYEY